MVKRGLKAGAVFTDGNLTYMVDEVLPNGNYISHVVPRGTKSVKAKEESGANNEKKEPDKEGEKKED